MVGKFYSDITATSLESWFILYIWGIIAIVALLHVSEILYVTQIDGGVS
jgi:hypothetical protein